MTVGNLWERFQHERIELSALGFRLDTSRMDLPDDLASSMRVEIDRALEAMKALEAGAIANPDERRQVGHYWLRAPEMAPTAAVGADIRETIAAVVQFAADVHDGTIAPPKADRFQRLLVIGIGGSALGPQFVSDALGSQTDRLRPLFLDNTDPDGIDRVLGALGSQLDRTLVVVISKSGGTPETRNGMLETQAAYTRLGLDFGRHAVAITGSGSKLDRFAEQHGFLTRFEMWDWVGGRTSETSVVGLLPAALQGIEIQQFLDGAAAMDRATRERDPRSNPALRLALAWHHEGQGRGAKDMVILPYRDRLQLFSRYLQQLVMESLGKERDLEGNVVHQGLAVYGNKGSTDQHAYVQQLRDGLPNFFATFIEVLHERDGAPLEVEPGVTSGDFLAGFLLGTRAALYENGRHSITISIDRLTPFSIGMLIALYERAVGLYATLIGVNAYHQPGVEAGKQAAAEILELQHELLAALHEHSERGWMAHELAEKLGRAEQTENVFHLLERLSRSPHRGLLRTPGGSPFEAVFSLRSN